LPIHHLSEVSYQSYISINPEVRIRKRINLSLFGNEESVNYKLCFKSDGDLSREEVEVDITEDKYYNLLHMISGEPIKKEYRQFNIYDTYIAECSIVDNDWMYAEVEFNSEEDANNFIPPDWFGEEVTYDKNYKMKNYWKQTRLSK